MLLSCYSSRIQLPHALTPGLLGKEAFVMTLAAQRVFPHVDGSWASAGVGAVIHSRPCCVLAARRAAVFSIALSMIDRGIRKLLVGYTAQADIGCTLYTAQAAQADIGCACCSAYVSCDQSLQAASLPSSLLVV